MTTAGKCFNVQGMTPAEKESKAPVETIKENLKTLCSKISLTTWERAARFYNSADIPIAIKQESPLLDPERHFSGTIQISLTRDGSLLEKLVHYSSCDGTDAEKSGPDEILGETSDQRYHEQHKRALYLIDALHAADDLNITPSGSVQ